MSVKCDPDGRWRYRATGHYNDGTSDRISGSSPKDENTKNAAKRRMAEAVAWMATQPPPPDKEGTKGKRAKPITTQLLVATAPGSEAPSESAEPPKPSVPTVTEFLEIYRETTRLQIKPASMYSKEGSFRRHIVPHLGHLRLDQVTYAAIEDFKLALSRTPLARLRKAPRMLCNKSINNILVVVNHMLEVARKRGVISVVPEIDWLKLPPPTFKFLSFDEADALIKGADGEWRTMIMLGLRTGMRRGELMALRWEDVDLINGRLTVRRNYSLKKFGTPKGGRAREIALGEDVITVLRAHRHERGELVFCDAAGKVFTTGMLKRPLVRAYKAAGLKPIGWHTLRHTFASHLAMLGVSLRAIQELLGHATIQMTERYAHLGPQVKRDAVLLLDGARRPRVSDGETAKNRQIQAEAGVSN